MAPIKSFHSAPHSLVQAAAAAHLKAKLVSAGISAAQPTMQEITSVLSTFPRRRATHPRTKVAASSKALSLSFDPECAALVYDYAVASLDGDTAQMTLIANEFEKSSCDKIGWAGAAIAYIEKQAKVWDQIVYRPASTPNGDNFVYALPEQDSFKIGIIGDWGTGESVAQIVLNAVMAMNVDLIIHVGDIYYAGTADEVQSNYLDIISAARQATGTSAPIYNLPGNHDYYTKGQPFYDALASVNLDAAFPNEPSNPLPVPVPTQGGSYFVLNNSWLQLQGMDTGYYDSDLFEVDNDTTMLHPDEATWHLAQLNNAQKVGCTVFLFSHHQAWSRFEGIGAGPGTAGGMGDRSLPLTSYNINLQSAFASAPVGLVRAWFWGHEHVLQVYDQTAIAASTVPPINGNPTKLSECFPWVNYGACIGYSAFPMLIADSPYGVASPDIHCNTAYQLPDPTGGIAVFAHGFAVLTVSKNEAEAPTAEVTYYALPGDGSSSTAIAVQPTSRIPLGQGALVS